jgi:hypothetical protein
MSDSHLEQSQEQLRRVVDSLLASRRRKQDIQRELLVHLQQAYEEELQGPVEIDGARAANAAARRLGNAHELREQLQSSIPLLERFIGWSRKEIVMSKTVLIAGGVVLMILWAIAIPDHAQFMAGALAMLAVVGLVRFGQRDLPSLRRLRPRLPLLLGVLAVLFGMAIVMPALHQMKVGLGPARYAGPLALGILIVLIGIAAPIYGRLTRRPQAS